MKREEEATVSAARDNTTHPANAYFFVFKYQKKVSSYSLPMKSLGNMLMRTLQETSEKNQMKQSGSVAIEKFYAFY